MHCNTLEDAARSFYSIFKGENRDQPSRHCLMLNQKLQQTRIACSGGRYPLEAENSEDEEDEEVRRRKRKKTKYSHFAFTSKLKTLIKELERIRDEDPSCKLSQEPRVCL
jgi:hypothetical protein